MGRKHGYLLTVLTSMSFASVTGGCSGGGNEVEAVVALAATVAVVAVHRAATDDCWGHCSPGYACNPKSGFCERGECDPICGEGYSCTTKPAGYSCELTKSTFVSFSREGGTQINAWGEGGSVMDPASNVAQPERAAGDLTPARSTSGQVQIGRGNPGPAAAPLPRPSALTVLPGAAPSAPAPSAPAPSAPAPPAPAPSAPAPSAPTPPAPAPSAPAPSAPDPPTQAPGQSNPE